MICDILGKGGKVRLPERAVRASYLPILNTRACSMKFECKQIATYC